MSTEIIAMLDFISSATKNELRFIANLDYGIDADLQFSALGTLISKQECVLLDSQSWRPYEVIELGSHWLQPGHEREFTICTLLVVYAVFTEFDGYTDMEFKLESRKSDYAKLETELSTHIFHAYKLLGL